MSSLSPSPFCQGCESDSDSGRVAASAAAMSETTIMIRNEMIRDNTNNVGISHKHDDSDGDAMMPQRQSPPPQTNMLQL
jgi:hypothetical protein